MTITRDEARTGRGAASNPEGRFEATRTEAVDDGWGILDEELPRLQTVVRAEPARTVITRNDSPDIMFEQSINPYRGCEHGCVYCLSGDTQVLMADGRTRALADIRVGDWVYGTAREGWYRRYTPTQVLAHWSVIKPAYRISLLDGTELIAGGDHRFLTERGWKFVTGSQHGAARRPHLTAGNKLMGIGALASETPRDEQYRRGYLCGLIRGDGMLASYNYSHRRRARDEQHHFRLALSDAEALRRAEDFLLKCEIRTTPFLFAAARTGRKEMQAIRTHARRQVEQIRELIAWPESPSTGWQVGFLSGIFDAEGSYSGGVLRISNTDQEIISGIEQALRTFKFEFAVEHIERTATRPIDVVRLLGGLREHLRFFVLTDPAISRKRSIAGQAVKSAAQLGVAGVEPLGKTQRLYDITTGTEDFIANGVVSHNCYARPSHAYLNLSPGLDFETKLFYKKDAARLLLEEISAPKYQCKLITLGANTDPYQPIEREYRVTRDILEALARYKHPVAIVTKGALIERDAELLAEMARERLVRVFISVTTLDPALKRTLEPRAAAPQARLRAIRTLSALGVPVGVMVAPVIPVLTDSELEKILEAAAGAGARSASYVLLRLPHEVKDLFVEWLRIHEPLKADHVMARVREMRGGRANDPRFGSRMRGEGEFADLLRMRFKTACRRLGLNEHGRFEYNTTAFIRPVTGPEQFQLL